MVNTEHRVRKRPAIKNYNILNIVVNTEPSFLNIISPCYYNILNIVVNTELRQLPLAGKIIL